MKLRARISAAVIALVSTGSVATLLFACVSDRAAFSEASDSGGDAAHLPPTSDGYDAAPPTDAADDYDVPDGAVVCADASPCVVSLAGAAGAFCALRDDGKVSCWGNNSDGQLGYDSGADGIQASAVARLVAGLDGVTHVDVGDGNTCARIADGGVYCWGHADLVNAGIAPVDGGVPLDSPVLSPTRETAVPSANLVGVGTHAACVPTAAGALTCWGKNDSLELGRGPTSSPVATPEPANLGNQTVTVPRLADSRGFALTPGGTLLSWGASTIWGSGGFLLGRDTSEDPDGVPALVPALTSVRAVASGGLHSCAVAGRLVACWGSNDSGQLGRGTFDYQAYLPGPTRLAFTVEADDIDAGATQSHDIPVGVAAGQTHSCAVMGSGRVYCWGTSTAGQLGRRAPNGADQSGYPTRIDGLGGPAVQVAAGHSTSCALLRSGTVSCWGANFNGELGQGTIDDRPHPDPETVPLAP